MTPGAARRARHAILASLFLVGLIATALLVGAPGLACTAAILAAALTLTALARVFKEDRP